MVGDTGATLLAHGSRGSNDEVVFIALAALLFLVVVVVDRRRHRDRDDEGKSD
jgi:hypothetical protein